MQVYLLHHLKILDDCDEVKLIGVYSTEDAARAAVSRLEVMPGFIDAPKLLAEDDEPRVSFEISVSDVDKTWWKEGFVTLSWDVESP